MELTLTGASLSSDGGAGGGANGQHRAHSHSHDHSHGHGHDHSRQCRHSHDHPRGDPQPSPNGAPHHPHPHPVDLSRLLDDPLALSAALSASVKVGSYDSFARISAAVLDREGETGRPIGGGGGGGTGGVVGGGTEGGGTVEQRTRGSALGAFGEDGHTLAHWAAKRVDDVRFLDLLTRVPGIDLNLPSRDTVGMCPLHWAATEGSIPIVAMLLRHLDSGGGGGRATALPPSPPPVGAASPSSRLSRRISSEMEAVPLRSSSRGDGEGGEGGEGAAASPSARRTFPPAGGGGGHCALPAGPADPINSRDSSGCTPLLIAAQYGHADLAAFLIKRGADADASDDSGDAALHWAAYKGSVPVCGLLLHLGGVRDRVDCPDAFGQTPLHLASLRGNVEVARYLLEEAESWWEGERRRRAGGGVGVGRRFRRGGGGSAPPDGAAGRREPSLPARLLELRDRDGKTPLDLAVKKRRAGCELVLREYMERHCAPRGVTRSRLARAGRAAGQFLSVRSWRSWLGLTPEAQSGAQSPSFPFYLVVVNMVLGLAMYPAFFLPVVGRVGGDPGVLWDRMGLHAFTLLSMAAMWASFLLTWRTDPGMLGNGMAGGAGGASSPYGGTASCGDCGNAPIREETDRVSRELRRRYDETLESYSEETTSSQKRPHPPLCHSCHIARPPRSKHCRVSRRCVLLFDHHCPFVGTTVGLYNYRYFYMFLLTGSASLLGFIVTWALYLRRSPSFRPLAALAGAYLSPFALPFLGMTLYHTKLVLKNLTTNEHQNLWRYRYLQDEYGRYRNPFDQGRVRNALGRLAPGEECYAMPMPAGTRGAGGVPGRGEEEEEERRDLMRDPV